MSKRCQLRIVDGFIFCPSEQQLLYDGNPVPLTNKAFETLQILISKNGHLVEKSEIMSIVWKDSFIEEGNLAVTIAMIRKALGDTRNNLNTSRRWSSEVIASRRLRGYAETHFTAPARKVLVEILED